MKKLTELLTKALKLVKELSLIAKAVVTFLAGLAGVLSLTLSLSPNGFTPEEATAVFNAVVVWLSGTFFVWVVPNRK